jgi:hypothetical protein
MLYDISKTKLGEITEDAFPNAILYFDDKGFDFEYIVLNKNGEWDGWLNALELVEAVQEIVAEEYLEEYIEVCDGYDTNMSWQDTAKAGEEAMYRLAEKYMDEILTVVK